MWPTIKCWRVSKNLSCPPAITIKLCFCSSVPASSRGSVTCWRSVDREEVRERKTSPGGASGTRVSGRFWGPLYNWKLQNLQSFLRISRWVILSPSILYSERVHVRNSVSISQTLQWLQCFSPHLCCASFPLRVHCVHSELGHLFFPVSMFPGTLTLN